MMRTFNSAECDRLVAVGGGGPGVVHAALGPAVGPCHYPVGDEVIRGLEARQPDRCWRHGRAVDLRRFLADELATSGVPRGNVLRVGPCTACDGRFASYRRDGGRAGRQLSVIARLSASS